MIVVLAHVQVAPQHRLRALDLATTHVARSRLEPGCVSHAVYEEPGHPNRLAFVEEWASEEDLLRHFAVPASIEFVNEMGTLAAARIGMRLYRADAMPFPRQPAPPASPGA